MKKKVLQSHVVKGQHAAEQKMPTAKDAVVASFALG